MTHLNANHYENRSVLASLRTVIPARNHITFAEALRIAELHANRLLELHRISDGPTPSELIAELPKLQIEYVEAPVSGASFWNGHAWIIQLNRAESFTRQRFTLAHEYKHIIDHGAAGRLYAGSRTASAADQAEQAADYFAGCLLVPRRLLKRAWGNGLQRPRDLARHFQVSEQAIAVRLAQTGLVERTARCRPPRLSSTATAPIRYYRAAPALQGA
ncbi:ImmA/IrrE family metallo-endopeptidase [Nocardia cyriacigeorgica]|uniref:ImmA/IrrE family metallo-endopeptidase n=1 Tax=Nocardia cyriacigeorgica TaxID=135487 RepID=UPI001893E39C|nr:ImmA/IrrE family metallo-endopeptidase [Nocardia cyriacigeorgica]MBF6097843.1 ImmA/IrrE family metallo-endopeptidase [Nocardia cyriacigeorgica]